MVLSGPGVAGILLISVGMLGGVFGRLLGYLGIATGVLGIAFVVGSMVSSGLGVLIIFTSALTTVWVLLVGHRLYRITASRRDPGRS